MQGEDRPLGELLAELSQQMSTMVRQEVDIAKTELMQKAFYAGRQVGFLAVGGALGYGGLLAIIAAVVIMLRELGLPLWLAALLVGTGLASVGGLLAWKGIDALRHEDLVPQKTIETLKEGQEWARAQAQ